MSNLGRNKWITRGYALTALLLAAVLFPLSGQTQGPPSNLVEDTVVTDSNNRQTDNPTGQNFIPVPDENVPTSNLPVTVADTDNAVDVKAASDATAQNEAALQADLNYTSPLVISAADFGADGANPDSSFFPFGGGYIQGDSENYGCMVAPVYLPNGATVTDMFVSVYDNDETYNIVVSLRRVDNFDGGTDLMAEAVTTGEYAGVQTIYDPSVTDPVVLYPDYAYYVTTCVLSGSIRLYSVRLYYTEP